MATSEQKTSPTIGLCRMATSTNANVSRTNRPAGVEVGVVKSGMQGRWLHTKLSIDLLFPLFWLAPRRVPYLQLSRIEISVHSQMVLCYLQLLLHC